MRLTRKRKITNAKIYEDKRDLYCIQPWHWPSRPWSRLHIAYAGPFLNKMFLIVIDSCSKWIDAFPVSAATSSVTIDKLRSCFATHGIPQVLVSDNASQFVSAEFQEYLTHNHIKHIRAPAYITHLLTASQNELYKYSKME